MKVTKRRRADQFSRSLVDICCAAAAVFFMTDGCCRGEASTPPKAALAEPAAAAGPVPAPADLTAPVVFPDTTELLVDFRDDVTPAEIARVQRLIVNEARDLTLATPGGIQMGLLHANSAYAEAHDKNYVVEMTPSALAAVAARVSADPAVEVAEPNYIYGLLDVAPPEVARGPAPKPNDPMYDQQWSFRMVGAQTAWSEADGSGIIVAVIDTGVACEDRGQLRRIEDAPVCVKGYDFVNDTEYGLDDHGHGSHCAGTIAQATNNRLGVAGLAPKARIMPLKVLSRQGFGNTADISDAIRFAADEGARVINLSLGGGPYSEVMAKAVAYAARKNVVVACAAGNGARAHVEYPAAYPGAFAVSAVGPNREKAFYSSWGREVAISAPGGDKQQGGEAGGIIQNTIDPTNPSRTNVYLSFQGTSMATPHVAGIAALVFSTGVKDARQVEEILKTTAMPAAGQSLGRDDRYGAGIVNAGAAVLKAVAMRPDPSQETDEARIAGWWDFLTGKLKARVNVVLTGLFASAIPPTFLTLLLLGIPGFKKPLGVLNLTWAVVLFGLAVLPTFGAHYLPSFESLNDRVWLFTHGGFATWLASMLFRKKAK